MQKNYIKNNFLQYFNQNLEQLLQQAENHQDFTILDKNISTELIQKIVDNITKLQKSWIDSQKIQEVINIQKQPNSSQIQIESESTTHDNTQNLLQKKIQKKSCPDKNEKKVRKERKKGTYKKYKFIEQETKKYIVDQINANKLTIQRASTEYQTNIANIKNWLKIINEGGDFSIKKGGRAPEYQEQENNLCQWAIEYIWENNAIPDRRSLTSYVKNLKNNNSTLEKFQISKGWIDKVRRRQLLEDRLDIAKISVNFIKSDQNQKLKLYEEQEHLFKTIMQNKSPQQQQQNLLNHSKKRKLLIDIHMKKINQDLNIIQNIKSSLLLKMNLLKLKTKQQLTICHLLNLQNILIIMKNSLIVKEIQLNNNKTKNYTCHSWVDLHIKTILINIIKYLKQINQIELIIINLKIGLQEVQLIKQTFKNGILNLLNQQKDLKQQKVVPHQMVQVCINLIIQDLTLEFMKEMYALLTNYLLDLNNYTLDMNILHFKMKKWNGIDQITYIYIKLYPILTFIVKLQYTIYSQGNTGIIEYSQSDITKISSHFGTDSGLTDFDTFPKFVGDIDGDGLDDIVICKSTGVFVLFNEGNIQFTDPIQISHEFGNQSQSFKYSTFNLYPRQIGDVDGDKKYDMVGFRDDGVYVAFSNGRQMMETSIKIYSSMGVSAGSWSQFNIYPRFVGDIDGDGKADFVGFSHKSVFVSFSNGRKISEPGKHLYFNFGTIQSWSNQNTYPRGIADINGDGKMDIIAHSNTTTFVALSTGRGELDNAYQYSNKSQEYTQGSGWFTFDQYPRFYGDLNRDGKMDIIGYAQLGVKIGITQKSNMLEGNSFVVKSDDYGTSTFPNQNTHTRLVGDINNDGITDLIAFQNDGVYFSAINLHCSHATRDPYNLCNCNKGYGEDQVNGECQQCNSLQNVNQKTKKCTNCKVNCSDCQYIQENCTSCIGINRVLPTCACDIGFFDDGSIDCKPCEYKCGQCQNLPDEFNFLEGIGGIKYVTKEFMSQEYDPFSNQGTVYKSGPNNQYPFFIRFGNDRNDVQNNIPILNIGDTYQFCVWIKLISGWQNNDVFSIDISDKWQTIFITDENGRVLKQLDEFQEKTIINLQLSSKWQRYCVNAEGQTNEYHKFIDLGSQTESNRIFMYSLPQLNKIKSIKNGPLPYTAGQVIKQCFECSHYTRSGINCQCNQGYQELYQNSVECHSPKPDNCDTFIRIECSGYIPMSQNIDMYANFYRNDVKIGGEGSKGFNFIVLDHNLEFYEQKIFNTLDNVSNVTQMINFINGLPNNQIVLVATMDEASKLMTTEAYEALQQLGMDKDTIFNFRDAFAMIGKKGLAPGDAKQGLDQTYIGGKVNLVDCIGCALQQFLQNNQEQNTCEQCDNTKCGTCLDLNTCIIPCDPSCKTCDTQGYCLQCIEGQFVNKYTKKCQNCNDLKCGTCLDLNTCIIPCDPSCKTCDTQGHCLTCNDGYYLEGNYCKRCDITRCGTCINFFQCIIPCQQQCKTCTIFGTCSCTENQFILYPL